MHLLHLWVLPRREASSRWRARPRDQAEERRPSKARARSRGVERDIERCAYHFSGTAQGRIHSESGRRAGPAWEQPEWSQAQLNWWTAPARRRFHASTAVRRRAGVGCSAHRRPIRVPAWAPRRARCGTGARGRKSSCGLGDGVAATRAWSWNLRKIVGPFQRGPETTLWDQVPGMDILTMGVLAAVEGDWAARGQERQGRASNRTLSSTSYLKPPIDCDVPARSLETLLTSYSLCTRWRLGMSFRCVWCW